MQVSVENVGKLERKLTVRVPAQQIETRVRERMRELGQTVRIKGFRPGKVPTKVIEQRFGQQVRNEAMSDLIGSSFQEAVRQQNLRPAANPSIQARPADGGAEIEYTATFEVVPDIGPIDVSNLAIVKTVSSVGEADIDRMIETLRQQRRQWTTVERPAAVNDMVVFEYSAQAGELRHPATGMDRVATIIGSGALFAQFEEQLNGVTAGTEKQAELSFPADFREPSLGGKTAQVAVKVIRVQEARMPEVDEAFVAAFGVQQGGVAQFRDDVRANLQRELTTALNARTKNDAVDKLIAAYQHLDLPQSMIQAEARGLLQQGIENAKRAGLEPPQSPEPFEGMASRRVLAYLLLTELARQNNLVPDQRRVSETLATIASTYEEPQKVVELYARDNELMSTLRSRVLEDQVIDWVLERAKVSDNALSFEQVMQPQSRG